MFKVWSDTISVAIGVVLPMDRHGVIQVDTGMHRSVPNGMYTGGD